MSETENNNESVATGLDAAYSNADISPVTVWLRKLEAGDRDMAGELFQHFCARLQNLVRRQIPPNVRTTYDDDDVALSAFHSLFLGVSERRFQFENRKDVWRLLITIAERKISNRIRYEKREKRDVGRLIENAVFIKMSPEEQKKAREGVDPLPGCEPTPEFAAEVAETCENLLAALPDEASRTIALLMLENYTTEQIAAKLGCNRRTVTRKLRVIRLTWQDAGQKWSAVREYTVPLFRQTGMNFRAGLGLLI